MRRYFFFCINNLLVEPKLEAIVLFCPFFLVGQSLSAFISTAFQHVSSCGRRHSLTESVHFASLSFLGLIRSFHNLSPDFSISYFSLFLTLFARNPTITFLIIS